MTTTTKKHTSLAFFNDNTKKAFRSLLRQLERQGLILYKVRDVEDDELHITDDIDVLDIMDHCFATEYYRLYVKYKDTYGVVVGHLDGCIESMFCDWGYPKTDYKTRSYTEIDQKIETACDNFNTINEDLELC